MAAVNKLSVLTRPMSSGAQMVKPPLQVFGLEGRYHTALYSAASKMKQLHQVEKDLIALQATIKGDKKLHEQVFSPIVNKHLIATALKEATGKLKMAPSNGNLFGLLADNGRLNKLDTVINAFRTIMAAHRGEVVCEVVTAKPLDAAQSKQLEGALKVWFAIAASQWFVLILIVFLQAFLKPNESLKITSRVDPSIIGGLVVSIGDKYVDMSIASKVKMYTGLIQSAA